MRTTTHYTMAEVHMRLRQAIKDAGSQKSLAVEVGIAESYLSDIMRGHRAFPDKLLSVLGLQWGIITKEPE